MGVAIRNGVGFSEISGARYIDLAAAGKKSSVKTKKVVPIEPKDLNFNYPWAMWGDNNLLPKEMAQDIECCGVLSSVIDGKSRFGLGRGILPCYTQIKKDGTEEITDVVQDAEILDFLDANDDFTQCLGWFKDLNGIGNGLARFVLQKDRKKIATLLRDDVTEMRYEIMDNYARINNVYLSAWWEYVADKNSQYLITIPLLDKNNPFQDLKNRTSGYEFALSFRYPAWNRRYYSMPLWYSAYKWVKIAQGVPDMKAALFQNNMRIKYMVVIYERYWTTAYGDEWQDYTDKQQEQKRQELYDDIDKFLVGSENAYKSIFVNGYFDKITGKNTQDIEITPIEDNTKQGELLPDAAAANAEISFAMLWNPAIFGGTQPSGPYTNSQGGSNVRESSLLQVMVAGFERYQIRRIMNVVKKYNGWDPKIQFMIPTSVLTTLDTGGSSKNVTQ